MTLCLYLFRHAEAERLPGIADVDRRLSARGRDDAVRMGNVLAQIRPAPALALVSPSQRTRETWQLASAGLAAIETRYEERIFEASAESLLRDITSPLPSPANVILVGHNPGLEDLARLLVRATNGSGMTQLQTGMPTASIAVIDLPLQAWRDVRPATGALTALHLPPSRPGTG